MWKDKQENIREHLGNFSRVIFVCVRGDAKGIFQSSSISPESHLWSFENLKRG